MSCQKLKVELCQICYIGLGSNQGDSPELLSEALDALAGAKGINLVSASKVYGTEPQGDRNQPWFCNQVAEIHCALTPHELLEELWRIENSLGRVRTKRRFGPRSIDLDILLYGKMVIKDENLTVPHPRMRERAFVLVPLAEIAPHLTFPDGTTLVSALENISFTLTGDKIYQSL